ncbi:ComEC/Rec2 family competence protein [Polycladidibacter stylochi]|uniref:ComEC/Rec2 family competence protein n=1 Tax=Polycladidibacter stylochi TaxID=1807766 RepID=UPI00082D00C4|nr:ComEC/Rec2 family competence protein [Pseudovibrio stylochi]
MESRNKPHKGTKSTESQNEWLPDNTNTPIDGRPAQTLKNESPHHRPVPQSFGYSYEEQGLGAPLHAGLFQAQHFSVRQKLFAFFQNAIADYSQSLLRGFGPVYFACGFAFGIWVYFSLAFEPAHTVLWLVLFGALCGLYLLYTGKFGRINAVLFSLLVAMGGGFAIAGLQVHFVQSDRLIRMQSLHIEAVVEAVRAGSGERVHLTLSAPKNIGRDKGSCVQGGLKQAEPNGHSRRLSATCLQKIEVSLSEKLLAKSDWFARQKNGVTQLLGRKLIFRVMLFPLGGARVPQGYDYAWHAYFRGVGASGYVVAPPQLPDALDEPSGSLGSWQHVGQNLQGRLIILRHDLHERILRWGAFYQQEQAAGFASALLTGLRQDLGEGDVSALRHAGLAHILAISGLHMGLVWGGFWLLLRFFSLLLHLSNVARFNLGWLGLWALAGCFVYLLVSGGAVASIRAFLMISLLVLGSFFGRRYNGLRALAFIFIGLLIVGPEDIFAPGFLMSFLAVLALLSTYEQFSRRTASSHFSNMQYHWFWQRLITGLRSYGMWLLMAASTSLIAGIATLGVSLFYFSQIAPLGLLGNLLAMPLLCFVIMPAGLVSFLFMPLGLEGPILALMFAGLKVVLDIAHWLSAFALDGEGHFYFSKQMFGCSLLLLAGLCVLPGRVKVVALLPAVALLYLLAQQKAPDLVIGASGRHFAFYNSNGQIVVEASRGSFQTDNLFQAMGFLRQAHMGARGYPRGRDFKGFQAGEMHKSCDALGCIYKVYPARNERNSREEEKAALVMGQALVDEAAVTKGKVAKGKGIQRPKDFLYVAHVKRGEAFERDCQVADIIISQLQAPVSCQSPLVLDGENLMAKGGAKVWFSFNRVQGPIALSRTHDLEGNVNNRKLEIVKITRSYEGQRMFHPPKAQWYEALIAAEQGDHFALYRDPVWPEDAGFVGGVGRFERN